MVRLLLCLAFHQIIALVPYLTDILGNCVIPNLHRNICLKVIKIIIIVPRTAFVYLAFDEEYQSNREKYQQNDMI